jgi:hypothetical protein
MLGRLHRGHIVRSVTDLSQANDAAWLMRRA